LLIFSSSLFLVSTSWRNKESSWKNSPFVYSKSRSRSLITPLTIALAISCILRSESAARCTSFVKLPITLALPAKQFGKFDLSASYKLRCPPSAASKKKNVPPGRFQVNSFSLTAGYFQKNQLPHR